MANLTAYVPPHPIPPRAPDFAFCNVGYGVLNDYRLAQQVGGILPPGALPRLYTVNDPAEPYGFYDLPYETSYSGVAVTVEVASPVDIDEIRLVPNDIRGMAGWLARQCVDSRGTGGFMTKGIQGLVNYVTDPKSNLDAPEYPDNTAFITVTLSTPAHAHSFPGDYDPQMAEFLQQVEIAALSTVEWPGHNVIAERILRYDMQADRMQRFSHYAWWSDPEDEGGGNNVSSKILLPLNESDPSAGNIRRRRIFQRSLEETSPRPPLRETS
ncbi:hypothetical protein P7C71_g1274, partial [Lecanoromycetidae sp. Uapishka_2]